MAHQLKLSIESLIQSDVKFFFFIYTSLLFTKIIKT